MPHLPRLHRGSMLATAGVACVLTACRADSVTTPEDLALTQAAAVDSTVLVPVSDAAERVTLGITDAGARQRLAAILAQVDRELQAGRPHDARLHLALAYAELDKLDRDYPEDAPEYDAVRLALVPAATALGVRQP